ncbi:MAG TPA: guanitoxin biosynthesis heme-dependent pre-guanitoxin N-hydroxylase GntA [Candidatus Udaeobacter sp.]|nr:guanitoxin biosynthesis heme-dependent pre-guanitoxin N-hydroxylase GntA [Candidatus Udaeobacter sp.]
MNSASHQPGSPSAEEEMKAKFTAFVADSAFPCLGAKAALNSGSQILRVYQELGAEQCARELARDLQEFIFSEVRQTNAFATFVAMFREPRDLAEKQFENLLWRALQQLHEIDVARHAWNEKVSSDTASPRFAFSFASEPLYVVGLHGGSSRLARRFPWPTLVFNAHEQFARLRQDGNWTKMQQTIRRRDIALQGSANPMLSDFGEQSEARQYSGRAVDGNWVPPFKVSADASAKSNGCPFDH